MVKVRYHDNQAGGQEKVLRLPVLEFIRRWLLHILPTGFMRIRYYGLHHSSARKVKLPQCRAHFGLPRALPVIKELVLLEWLQELLGDEVNRVSQLWGGGQYVLTAGV
ncbi:MAG: transposase [Anaerolineales bacterium]|nr:transposase [Anaerolineales bacterium]